MADTPLLLLILAILFLVVWLASVGFVAWDVAHRPLPGSKRLLWLAVAVVPVAGLAIYLAGRAAPGAGHAGNKRATALMAPAGLHPLPTIAVGDIRAARQPALPSLITLAAMEGPHRGQAFTLAALPARVGRDSGCGVRLDDDRGVSRQHAELYEQDGRLRVRDLNSTHGTLVNDHPVADAPLGSGDRLRVGRSVLVLRADQ